LGTMGHFGCLSFHETKNIISGEGGALLINDKRFLERAEIIREKGTNRTRFFRGEVDKYTWVDIGSSYLPSELIGAFLYAQMENASAIIAARRRIFERYYSLLRPLEDEGFLRLPYVDSECASNGHMFYMITRSLDERTRMLKYLKKQGILAVFHYIPLHSSPAGEKYGRVSGGMEITCDLSDRLIRLPIYYEMRDEDIIHIVESVRSFFEKK